MVKACLRVKPVYCSQIHPFSFRQQYEQDRQRRELPTNKSLLLLRSQSVHFNCLYLETEKVTDVAEYLHFPAGLPEEAFS